MIISIEGNIGSGKSKFVELFKDYLEQETSFSDKFIFLSEPVDEWINTRNENNENILEVFYKDRKRWSYTFQMNAFITRSKLLMDCNQDKIIVSERSVLTDKHIFAKSCFEDSSMDIIEEKLYNKWFDWLSSNLNVLPDLIVYLQASPQVSYERMKKRGRKEEENVSFQYIEKISQYHDDWLSKKKQNVLVLNVDSDFENNKEKLILMIKDIMKFMTLNFNFSEKLFL